MKKLLVAALLCAVCASPAFAGKKPHKEPHQKYDYHYKTPKYKAPKAKGTHSRPKHVSPHQSK